MPRTAKTIPVAHWLPWAMLVLTIFGASSRAALGESLGAQARKVLFLGDSLSEGYGLAQGAAYPDLVAAALKAKGYHSVQVVNASISGSTSASGPGRLAWALKAPPAPTILVLALGANDGLRGFDPKVTKGNLEAMVVKAKAAGVKHIVVAGMQMPANYGQAYTSAFAAIFQAVAKEQQINLLPFLLEGVAGERSLNQSDGIHPNAEGAKIMAQTVLKHLLPLLGPPP